MGMRFGANRLRNLAEERVDDIRNDQAEQAGGVARHITGIKVGLIMKLLDGGLNAPSRAGFHRVAVIDDRRNGRRGNPGELCNIIDACQWSSHFAWKAASS